MSKKHLEQKVRDKAAERDRYMSELFLAERSRCDCDGCAERDKLRSLIVYWCDVVDDIDGHPSDYHQNVAAAEDELRKAVGR